MRSVVLSMATLALFGFAPAAAQAAPGDLDLSFGSGGAVVSDFGIGNNERARDVAVDAAGRTVVVGSSSVISEDAPSLGAVTRYTPSGAPDPTFGGGDGQVLLSVGPDIVNIPRAVAADTNGRIVIAGLVCSDFYCEGPRTIAVARLMNSGQPDPTFGGGDGTVAMQVADYVSDVAIDADGRIVMAGASKADLAALRLTPDGALDPTFGGDGVATVGFNDNGYTYGYGVALDSLGRIAVAGTAIEGEEIDYAVARFQGNGILDPSFSGDGRGVADVGSLGNLDYQSGLAVDSHDRIVVVGQSFAPSLTGPNQLAMVRYTASGSPDAAFGDDGVVLSEDDFYSAAVAIDTSDRVLITGYHDGDVLARFQPNGAPDPAFGGGDGSVPVPFWILEGLTIDPQRRIVVAGNTSNGSNNDFAAARFLSGEPVPPSRTLSVSVGGAGSGSITGPGVSCPSDCTESYAKDTPVMLIASPNAGSTFAGWSGGGCSGSGACGVTLDADTAISATFNVQPSGGSGGSVGSSSDQNSVPPGPTSKQSRPKPRAVKCRKGFKKRKIKGKVKCVKKGRKGKHRQSSA